ncbi:MAG: T9SS type A sorting domain-containing protein [Bacteroidota bacterium]
MKSNFLTFGILLSMIYSLSAQSPCINGEHRSWENTWASCQESSNPNTARNLGHWIMYDFGDLYSLTTARIWNTNETGKTNIGFRNVVVDYSSDGVNWTELGGYELERANGLNNYAGFEAFDFDGRLVRYVLISAIDNWGHPSCYGLAEVRFEITSGIVLPVEYLYFDAQLQDENTALLTWETVSEVNSDYFDIQKSFNGALWRRIGYVRSGRSFYSFSDEEAFGAAANHPVAYYRLEQFDLDGRSSYSEIRAVTSRAQQVGVHFFPNPAHERLYVSSSGDDNRNLRISIYNNTGQKVREQVLEAGQRSLNIKSLKPGIYYLAVGQATSEHYFKFIKI